MKNLFSVNSVSPWLTNRTRDCATTLIERSWGRFPNFSRQGCCSDILGVFAPWRDIKDYLKKGEKYGCIEECQDEAQISRTVFGGRIMSDSAGGRVERHSGEPIPDGRVLRAVGSGARHQKSADRTILCRTARRYGRVSRNRGIAARSGLCQISRRAAVEKSASRRIYRADERLIGRAERRSAHANRPDGIYRRVSAFRPKSPDAGLECRCAEIRRAFSRRADQQRLV